MTASIDKPSDPSATLVRGPVTLPVVEESLSVSTVSEEIGAVRVRIESEHVLQSVDVAPSRRLASIEREPRNEVVEAAVDPWWEGPVLVVPVYVERPVVKTELVLVETIRIQHVREAGEEIVQVPIRRQRAVVERRQPDGSWKAEGDAASSG